MLFANTPTLIASTPLHPFNGAVKNKAWFNQLPCACGQFIHYTHSFRFFPLHSIPLHYFVAFISLTSAPHSKSNSFFTFHKANTQAFRVMAFAYPTPHGFLCWNNLQKTATAQCKLLMPLQASNRICSIPFSHCICSWPTARLKAVCFIFFCEVFTPSIPRKTVQFQLKFYCDWKAM